MITIGKTEVPETGLPKSRLFVGGVIFIMGFLSPLLVPFVTNASLPVAWKATISGLLLVGVPELAMLLAVAVMGKEGFNYLKKLLYGFLGKHFSPPETVSPLRYRIGLVLFTLPLLLGWVMPYISGFITAYEGYRLWFAIIGDFILLSSLFVLGGEFWDKLRALFIYKTKVNLD